MANIFQSLLYLFIFPGGVFAISIALLLAGIDRIIVARMQLRQGPPLLQPVYDIFKLFGKEVIVPRNASKKAFLIAPVIGLASILVIPVFIPIFQNIFVTFSADIIVIIYLLTIPAICLIVGGSSSSSFWGGIGASREMVTIIGYELPMVMALFAVCKKTGEYFASKAVFSMEGIVNFQALHGMSITHLSLIPAAIAFLMVIPAEVGVVPFDVAEAETEICEGPLVEYSGLYLALYKLTSNVKAVVMASLFVSVFMGGNGVDIDGHGLLSIILSIALFMILIFIVLFFSVTLVRAIVGRFKVNQSLKFYWIIPTGLALLSLILVFIGI